MDLARAPGATNHIHAPSAADYSRAPPGGTGHQPTEWPHHRAAECPRHIASTPDDSLGTAIPDISGLESARGSLRGSGTIFGENSVQLSGPVQETKPKPLHLSSWTEGNLLYRVQPVYPVLARQARIQGIVELRAIISKTGTIENLSVLAGPPLLVQAARDAVLQWRYRPYLLNGEPTEVETEVTVNFVLGGD